MTNSDCEFSPAKPVCKQMKQDGKKTCQGPETSTKECLPGQYSDSEDVCITPEPIKGTSTC